MKSNATTKTTLACYGCGKAVKGQYVRTVPTNLLIALQIDFGRDQLR